MYGTTLKQLDKIMLICIIPVSIIPYSIIQENKVYDHEPF